MNKKIETLLARAHDVLQMIELGKLDPSGVDMLDIHEFSLELGEAFKDSYTDYIYGDGYNTDRLLTAYRDIRRALPIGENGKRWQSWKAYQACN
tara:strand:+ start:2204 stop:2485 length:282 start_codon:yes stop_codon:yes gene_type:complete